MKIKSITIERTLPKNIPGWASGEAASQTMYVDKVNDLRYKNYLGEYVSSPFIIRDIQGLGWPKITNTFSSEVGRTKRSVINVNKVQRDITFIFEPYGHKSAEGVENLRAFFNSFFIDQKTKDPLIKITFDTTQKVRENAWETVQYYTKVYMSEINTVYFSQDPMLSVTFQSEDDYFEKVGSNSIDPIWFAKSGGQPYTYSGNLNFELKEGQSGVDGSHRLIHLKNVQGSTPVGLVFDAFIKKSYVEELRKNNSKQTIGFKNYMNDTYFYAGVDVEKIKINGNSDYGFVRFSYIPDVDLAPNYRSADVSVSYSQGYSRGSYPSLAEIPGLYSPSNVYKTGVWDNFRTSDFPPSLIPGSNVIGVKTIGFPKEFVKINDARFKTSEIFDYDREGGRGTTYDDNLSIYYYNRVGGLV